MNPKITQIFNKTSKQKTLTNAEDLKKDFFTFVNNPQIQTPLAYLQVDINRSVE